MQDIKTQQNHNQEIQRQVEPVENQWDQAFDDFWRMKTMSEESIDQQYFPR